VVGLALLVAAALAWLFLVPPARAQALELSSQRAGVEREHDDLARRVERLARERGVSQARSGGARRLGAVELRAVVVEVLQRLDSGSGIRLDVQEAGADPARLRLSLSGELDDVLTLIDGLRHPGGPVVLTRVSLRPQGQDTVQLELEGLQPETSP
jgi:hypothetical protein